MFTLLEKQANLLLGRKVAREGSISVTIGKSIFSFKILPLDGDDQKSTEFVFF